MLKKIEKPFYAILFLLSSLLFLTSCGSDETEALRAENIGLREALSESQSNFNLFIGLMIALVIISFLLGIALGTKTKNDYKKQIKLKEDDTYER